MFRHQENEPFPSPTEEQLQTMLVNQEIGLSSEIISSAFEPRFKLIALGSATGDFYVINEKNYVFSFLPIGREPPVLKIIPLINSPTFLSISGLTLFENHCMNTPRQDRPIQTNNIFYKEKTILSEVRPEKFNSIITHWIVIHDGNILQRSKKLKYDIIDFAASPVHPEFILLLTKKGSIYGFSVEEMSFTNLYIDAFEGKNVHSIICPSEVNFYICHDFIEKLDMTEKTVSDGFDINALQIDIFDEKKNSIAVIQSNSKTPSLFKGNRQSKKVDLPSGSVGTFVSMITDSDWTSVVHSKEADSIYLKSDMKIRLEDEILVPSIVVEYQNHLERDGPRNVTFFTNTGRFINLNGNSIDHFILNPIEPKLAFIDKNENIYVFNASKKCHIFEKNNYMGCFIFDWGKPLTVLNGFALCLSDNNDLLIVDIKKNEKVNLNSPLVPSPIVSYQLFEEYIDFLCIDRKVFRIDLSTKEIFEGHEVVDPIELSVCVGYQPSQNNRFWRPFCGSFACIKQIESVPVLIFDKLVIGNICGRGEEIILFDIIDRHGKVSAKNAIFILLVTSFSISLFGLDENGLTRMKHVTMRESDPIIEASVASWGVLIVRMRNSVKLLVLPDISRKPICTLSLTYDAPPPLQTNNNNNNNNNNDDDGEVVRAVNPIILPHKGLIVFERNLVTIYLKKINLPPCFDKDRMPELLVQQTSGIKKIFGKKPITVGDADRIFQFQRKPKQPGERDNNDDESAASTAANVANSLSETQEMMQLALSKANERGEILNELEIKAQKLLEKAREYRDNCRKFKH